MPGNPSSELSTLEKWWSQHFAAIDGIRRELAKEGATIQVDIVVRDKAATERYAKRKASAKKRRAR